LENNYSTSNPARNNPRPNRSLSWNRSNSR